MDMYVSRMSDSAYLEHYGVKGMRWGVRKDQYASGGKDPSKRKVRKSIKKAYKATKKAGSYNSTGANMDAVDKQVEKAYKNDEQRKAAIREANRKLKPMLEAQEQYTFAQRNKAYMDSRAYDSRSIYDQVSETGTASQRDNAKRDYKRDRKLAEKAAKDLQTAKAKYGEAEDAYNKADNKRLAREHAISKSFKEQHLNAAVKDIGFEDVNQGRRLLKEYGLEDYALNPSYLSRLTNRTGVRML